MHKLNNLQVFAAGANDILDYKPRPKSLLIRIIDEDVTYHPIKYIDEYESVFEIHVIDIDLTEYDADYSDQLQIMFNDQLFKSEHAEKLITYLQQYNPEDIQQIVVHCLAGVSRSVAVAYFIAQYYFHNDSNAKAILDYENYLYGGNNMIREILVDTWCTLTNDKKIQIAESRNIT